MGDDLCTSLASALGTGDGTRSTLYGLAAVSVGLTAPAG